MRAVRLRALLWGTCGWIAAVGACSTRSTPAPPADAGAFAVSDASVEAADASGDSPADIVTDATQFADGGYPILSRFAGKRVLHCGEQRLAGQALRLS